MGAEGSKPSPTVVAEQEGGNANAATHSAANSTTDEGISSTTPAKIEEHKDEKEDPSQPLVYYFYATLQMYIPIEDVRRTGPLYSLYSRWYVCMGMTYDLGICSPHRLELWWASNVKLSRSCKRT